MLNITCACLHTDDFDRFTVSPMGQPLPTNHYQCPACRTAWTIRNVGQARMTESGFVIPPDRKIVPVQGVL